MRFLLKIVLIFLHLLRFSRIANILVAVTLENAVSTHPSVAHNTSVPAPAPLPFVYNRSELPVMTKRSSLAIPTTLVRVLFL